MNTLTMNSKISQRSTGCSFDTNTQFSNPSCSGNRQPRLRSPLSVKETSNSGSIRNLSAPVDIGYASQIELINPCEQYGLRRPFTDDSIFNRGVVFRHKNKRNLSNENALDDRILLRSSPINSLSQDKNGYPNSAYVEDRSNRNGSTFRGNSHETKHRTRPLFESNKLLPTFCGENANMSVASKKLYHITVSSSE